MRTVLLTGGSEIVATALFEELMRADVPLAVVALGVNSLLRDIVPDDFYVRLDWPPAEPGLAARALWAQLRAWGASRDEPWNILPTEDGGLRLLLEYRKEFLEICRFGHARNLQMGGLDKAELFQYLEHHGCTDVIPATVAVSSVDAALQAVSRMGGDCIIKPALKPFSMDLSAMGAKAIATNDYQEQAMLEHVLRKAWPTASEWVVQRRLDTPAHGEDVVWILRDMEGRVSGVTAVERWKYPRVGGSGCWVETGDRVGQELFDRAAKVLAAIDYLGLCEIPFLLDDEGKPRMLELNPRPWLQVALPGVAGCPMGRGLVTVLGGGAFPVSTVRPNTSWVNLERLLAAALSGQQGPRLHALLVALRALMAADVVAIYSTKLPRVRLRWFARMCKRLWS